MAKKKANAVKDRKEMTSAWEAGHTEAEKDAHVRFRESLLNGEGSYPKQLKSQPYEEQLEALQIELLKLQSWVKAKGKRVCIIFEGRDAAGKGGAIKRFTENINPRGARVVALPAPSDVEKSQWYFQRYVAQLPSAGEIVLFDRSWYNRAVVERVMNFCTPEQYDVFVRQVASFERMLIEDGIILVKFFFGVGEEEQKRRFDARRTDPLKQWKLSPVDEQALKLYDKYTEAIVDMMLFSDTDFAPWVQINGNQKRRARLASIGYCLSQIDYAKKDKKIAVADPAVAALVRDIFSPGDLVLRRK